MPHWEYKAITSGVHGFATPALLETYLNNLGKDEWEIVNYQPSPTNPLAFTGLVRRPTQRDWSPPEPEVKSQKTEDRGQKSETSAPAAAQSGTGSLPVKTAQNAATPSSTGFQPVDGAAASSSSTGFQPVTTAHSAAGSSGTGDSPVDASAATADSDNPKSKIQNPESLRPVRDTERDQDPDAPDNDSDTDDWDTLGMDDDDLPTFFDALKPHYRANARGPGKSIALDYLVKRWELTETDLLAALKECGLTIPETEDAAPEYFEFEDDLYWVNRTNRGQFFINTREKPRPKFRIVPAKPLSPDDPAFAELAAERAEELARIEKRNAERAEQAAAASARAEARRQKAEAQSGTGSLPVDGAAASSSDTGCQPVPTARNAATPSATTDSPSDSANPQSDSPADSDNPKSKIQNPKSDSPAFGAAADATPAHKAELTDATRALLQRIRPLMRRNRHGPGYSGSITFLARALKTTHADLSAQVTDALGVPLPETNGIKPTFVEIENALYWLNKDSRGNIWINGRELKPRPTAQGSAGVPPADEGRPDPRQDLPPSDGAGRAMPARETRALPAPQPTEQLELPAGVAHPAKSADGAAAQSRTGFQPVDLESSTGNPARANSSTGFQPVPTAPGAAGSSDTNDSPVDGVPATASENTTLPTGSSETPHSELRTPNSALTAVRLLLKPNKRGTGVSGETGYLARTLGKPESDFIATLTAAGLVVPPDADAKPVFVEHAGEIFWFSHFEKDGQTSLWLNAKPARKKPGRPRTRKPKSEETETEE